MAIIGYRVTFEFATVQDVTMGWSENYWNNAGTLQGAIQAGITLATFRMALCPNTIQMTYLRVSAYPFGTRLATIINVGKIQQIPDFGQYTAQVVSEAGWVKGKMRLVGTTGQFTHQWLGGLPGGLKNQNAQFNPTGAFKSALNAFFAALVAQGFCVRKLLQGAPNAKFPINSITNAGVVVCPNNTFGTSGNVSITGIAKGFGVRGVWPIQSNDGSNVMLRGMPVPTAAIPGNKKSFAQLYNFGLIGIGNNSSLLSQNQLINTIQAITKHNVGRVFGQASGRRKALVR